MRASSSYKDAVSKATGISQISWKLSQANNEQTKANKYKGKQISMNKKELRINSSF